MTLRRRLVAGFVAGSATTAVLCAAGLYLAYRLYQSEAEQVVVRTPDFSRRDRPTLDFPIFDLKGRRVDVESEHPPLTLLHLWATWCPPCRPELGAIDRLNRRWSARGLRTLVISDEDAPTLTRWAGRHSYSFPYLRTEAFPAPILDRGRPRTLFLDAAGAILFDGAGAYDWGHPNVERFLATSLPPLHP